MVFRPSGGCVCRRSFRLTLLCWHAGQDYLFFLHWPCEHSVRPVRERTVSTFLPVWVSHLLVVSTAFRGCFDWRVPAFEVLERCFGARAPPCWVGQTGWVGKRLVLSVFLRLFLCLRLLALWLEELEVAGWKELEVLASSGFSSELGGLKEA